MLQSSSINSKQVLIGESIYYCAKKDKGNGIYIYNTKDCMEDFFAEYSHSLVELID